MTPIVAYALTAAIPARYESSAEVLLDRNGRAISGLFDPTFWENSRTMRTEAELAGLPAVLSRSFEALENEGVDVSASAVATNVTEDGNTDILAFHAKATDPVVAAVVATAYAEGYVAERKARDTASLRRAIAVINAQVARARGQGAAGRDSYAALVQQQQQLNVGLATLESNARLVKPAAIAARIGPEPLGAALAALVLGLVTGVGLAALTLVLSARAGSPEEIADDLGLSVLAYVPLERRFATSPMAATMQSSRNDTPHAEAIRRLRTNLELELRDRDTPVVMVTSAIGGEGTSTTVAELAVALTLAGRRVVVVDLDFRRPSISRLFDVPRAPGIADVARGVASLDDATRSVGLHTSADPAHERAESPPLRIVPAGNTLAVGMHDVLAGVGATLAALRRSADVVLIDAPPLMAGDAVAFTTHADAIVLVARTTLYRRPYGPEIVRLLARSPATPLGIVIFAKPDELGSLRQPLGSRRALRAGNHALGRV